VLVEFWILNAAGALVCPLPDVDSWTISPVANDAGAAELVYPVTGLNWSTLHQCVTQDRRVTLQVRIDGNVRDDLRITLFEANGDDVHDDGTWSYRGWLPMGRLRDAVVEPKSGMPAQDGDSTIEQDGHYYSATAGTIMSTLITEAHVRDALGEVTYDFTSTHDSNGVAWTQIITLKFTPGIDYLRALSGLIEAGMCEARMVGSELQLFQPGTVGVDRTLTNPPLIFRKGQSLTDAPRKHTTDGLATAVLAVGGEGEYTWEDDTAAHTRLGYRIETSVSQGSITDPGTLTAYAQHWLEGAVTGRMQVTHGGVIEDGPIPLLDFDTGDWSWSELASDGVLEKLRVAQWVLSMASDGVISWTAVLNDLIAERTAALARRLQGIEGGTTIAGTSNARQIPDSYIDGEPPEPPDSGGVTVESVAYITDEGTVLAAVTVQWDAVLFNQDGTAMTDLARYVVQWRYADGSMQPISALLSWNTVTDIGDLFANFSAVRPGVWIDVRIGAADVAGNFSGWSSTVTHLTANDTGAPPTPPAPIATAFIGTIKWEWNGLGALGEPMPADFSHAEFHVSTVNNFTESSATLYDTLPGPGAVAQTNAAYGTTYYGRLVLVDTSGNKSTHSAIASTQPRQILNPDIANLSIGSAQIIDLDVGKITAGTLSAAVILTGSIATASSGARFGMNSSEFFAYNSGGTKTVSITNAGAASLLGEIRTAASGARIVVNPAGTAPTEMRFYPANSSLGKYISLFTTDVPGWPGYSLVYLKGDRYTGLSGEGVLRMWHYEAAFGWFDSTAGLLTDTESSVYARQYSAGMNGSRLLFVAHGLRDSPWHEFAFTTDSITQSTGMGRFFRDGDNAFIMACPAKGSALCLQGNWVFAVSAGNTANHVGFTALTVTQSSGQAVKTNISDIDHDVLAVLEAAPSRRWEYTQDHQPVPKSPPIRRHKLTPGGAPTTEVIEIDTPDNGLPIQGHFGPMAEDLPAGVRVYTPQDPSAPHIDHGSFMGYQWEILRRLHALVKKQGQQIADLQKETPRGRT